MYSENKIHAFDRLLVRSFEETMSERTYTFSPFFYLNRSVTRKIVYVFTHLV